MVIILKFDPDVSTILNCSQPFGGSKIARMKNVILAICCCSAIVCRAQNAFYMQPQIGVGWSGVAAHDNLMLGQYENKGRGSVAIFNGELATGYRWRHWELSSGLFFLRSGFYEHTRSGYMFLTDTRVTQYYNHVSLPVIVGFRINAGRQFSIIPGIGSEISYNYADHKTIEQNGVTSKETLKSNAFTHLFKQTSFWSIVRLQMSYKLSKKTGVVAGPELHTMTTSMLASGYNPAAFQYSRILSFSAGIRWRIGK